MGLIFFTRRITYTSIIFMNKAYKVLQKGMIKIFLSEKLKYMAYVMPEKWKLKPACTLSASVYHYKTTTTNKQK